MMNVQLRLAASLTASIWKRASKLDPRIDLGDFEPILDGAPKSGYMDFGDTIRIEAKGRDGQSVFGAIEQTVVALDAAGVRRVDTGGLDLGILTSKFCV